MQNDWQFYRNFEHEETQRHIRQGYRDLTPESHSRLNHLNTSSYPTLYLQGPGPCKIDVGCFSLGNVSIWDRDEEGKDLTIALGDLKVEAFISKDEWIHMLHYRKAQWIIGAADYAHIKTVLTVEGAVDLLPDFKTGEVRAQ